MGLKRQAGRLGVDLDFNNCARIVLLEEMFCGKQSRCSDGVIILLELPEELKKALGAFSMRCWTHLVRRIETTMMRESVVFSTPLEIKIRDRKFNEKWKQFTYQAAGFETTS